MDKLGTTNTLDQILPAIAKVKAQLGAVMKKTNNPFFKSKYADLNTYLDEVEPLLAENGLVLLQPVTAAYAQSGLENIVTSRIVHVASGQSIESSMKLVGGSDMQKLGSGVTYARRYTLGSLLSMKAEDDDGNHASGKTSSSAPKKTFNAPAAKTETQEASAPTPTNRPSFRRPNKDADKPAQVEEADMVSQGDDL